MKNATELTLVTKSVIEDGTALLYAGPLTEVVMWRDSRTAIMHHAQPGEYIVQDRDGYARRYSAADFATLFEAAPVPSNVTSAAASAQLTTSLTLTWTDSGSNKVNIYQNGAFLAQVNNAVQTKAVTGLVVNTAYVFVLKAVNGYGQEGTGVTVTTHTAPLPVTSPAGAVLATTATNLTWVAADATSGFAVYRKTTGSFAKIGSTLAAGTTFFNDTGLTTGTLYHYVIRAVSAVGAIESANSTQVDLTTS